MYLKTRKFIWFVSFFFTGNRDVFGTQSNIYGGFFLTKKVNMLKYLTIFAKKLHHRLLVGF